MDVFFWPEVLPFAEDYTACLNFREAAAPLIMDKNHMSIKLKRHKSDMFFILTRVDTSTKRYPFSNWEAIVRPKKSDWICPNGDMMQNL